MTECIPAFLRDSEPANGAGGNAPSANASTEKPKKPSLLGSASQYRHAPALPVVNNITSVTGATIDDPTGDSTRQKLIRPPDWDSPFSGFRQAFEAYGISFLIFWFGTGVSLSCIMQFTHWFPPASDRVKLSPAFAMFVAPGYGFYENFTHGVVGILFFMLEAPLILVLLLSARWPARLKYGIAIMIVVALNAVILGQDH